MSDKTKAGMLVYIFTTLMIIFVLLLAHFIALPEPEIKTFQVYKLSPNIGEYIVVGEEEGVYNVVAVDRYTSFGYDYDKDEGLVKMDFINLKLSKRSEK